MSVSAIVVSYETGPVLARCIAALRADPAVSEIILVDNGNPPRAVEKAVTGEGAPAIILSGHGNIGFAAACNKGAARASAEFLLFINPDAVLPESGATKLLADGASLPRPWLMGAKLVDPDGREQRGSRRSDLTPWRAIVDAAGLYQLGFQRFNLHEMPLPDDVAEIETISGACFFLPAEDYARIGGMDERYFLHVEDVDFCRRFRQAGGHVFFNPQIAVTHEKSSSRIAPAQVSKWKTESFIRYFHTHFSKTYPAPILWLVDGLLWGVHGARSLAAAFTRGR